MPLSPTPMSTLYSTRVPPLSGSPSNDVCHGDMLRQYQSQYGEYPQSSGVHPAKSFSTQGGGYVGRGDGGGGGGMKGEMKKEVDASDLRLILPVRNGVLLNPFQLPHDVASSNHEFHLTEAAYQQMMCR